MADDRPIILPLRGAARNPASTGPGPTKKFTATNGRCYIAFSDTQDESLIFGSMYFPTLYSSGGTLKILWSASGGSAPGATVDTVRWTAQVMATSPGDTASILTESFAAAATVDDEADNTNARALQTASITLTMDSAAAGDAISIIFGRDAGAPSNELAEDAWLWGLALDYTPS